MSKTLTLLLALTLISGCAKPKDGANGSDGSRGPAGESIVGPSGAAGSSPVIEVITPCPDLAGSYPEILWRLNGGKLYAVYASGANIHLTEVPQGHYQTTDGRSCLFSVDSSGGIVYP